MTEFETKQVEADTKSCKHGFYELHVVANGSKYAAGGGKMFASKPAVLSICTELRMQLDHESSCMVSATRLVVRGCQAAISI